MRFHCVRRIDLLALIVVAILAFAACFSTRAAPSLRLATFEEFATDACDAFEAMFRAVGNPDAGTDSELSKALDEAVQRGDPAEAGRLAEAITVELESGRTVGVTSSGLAAGLRDDEPARSRPPGIRGADRREAPGRGEFLWTGPSGGVRSGRWLDAWGAMFEAARAIQTARPANLPPHECEGVPISF